MQAKKEGSKVENLKGGDFFEALKRKGIRD
jgi:hypothetical protein